MHTYGREGQMTILRASPEPFRQQISTQTRWKKDDEFVIYPSASTGKTDWTKHDSQAGQRKIAFARAKPARSGSVLLLPAPLPVWTLQCIL